MGPRMTLRRDPEKARAWQRRSAQAWRRRKARDRFDAVAYEALRVQVYERAGGRCELRVSDHCDWWGDQVHHLFPQRKGRVDTLANCRWSCHACNVWVENHPARARELGLLLDQPPEET